MNQMTTFYIMILFLMGFFLLPVAGPQARPAQDKDPVKTFYEKLVGDWKGSYSLWLRPGTQAQKSEITSKFQSTAKGNYFLMTYTWEQGGKVQEGLFLLGGKGKKATANWGDSFYSVPEAMQCKGNLQEAGKKLVVKGSYAAGEGPDWGWRTEFTLKEPNGLLMEAYNIMPSGMEALAVKAELERMKKKEK